MALAEAEIVTQPLTYAAYLTEGEVNRRYDIIDGVRYYQTGFTILHQEVLGNLLELLRAYQRQSRRGKALIGPRDVLIRRQPFCVRQPDAMFISRERYAGRTPHSIEPLSPAPELVIEILSSAQPRAEQEDRIEDYCMANVQECWLINPQGETVEVLRLTPDGPERVTIYGAGQTVQSLTFPDLVVALDDIFRIEE